VLLLFQFDLTSKKRSEAAKTSAHLQLA